MKVLGIKYSNNSSGEKVTTLFFPEEFAPYDSNKDAGRGCSGLKTGSLYVGNYDCSAIKVGSEIEIYYDEAIKTKSGSVFQPVKKIEVIGK